MPKPNSNKSINSSTPNEKERLCDCLLWLYPARKEGMAMSGHIDKQELIGKLKALDGLIDNERASLIGLLNSHKKYGLVWEDKPEEAEKLLEDHLPVLKAHRRTKKLTNKN